MNLYYKITVRKSIEMIEEIKVVKQFARAEMVILNSEIDSNDGKWKVVFVCLSATNPRESL